MFSEHLKKSLVKLVGAGVLAQAIILVAMPILTRIYGPSQFGYYGIFISLGAILAAVSSGRLELAIPVARSEDEATSILFAAVIISMPVIFLLSIILFEFSVPLGIKIISVDMIHWLIILAFSIVIFQVFNYWLVRQCDYSVIGKVRLIQGVGLIVGQLFFSMISVGPWCLIAGYAFGQVVAVVAAIWLSGLIYLTVRAKRYSWQKFRNVLTTYKMYPTVMTPAALLNMLGQHLPTILIGGMYGAESAGLYVVAQRVCSSPLALIGQAVGQIYIGEAPKMIRESMSQMRDEFKKLASILLLLGGIFVLFVALFAPYVMKVVFGKDWDQAGVLMQILGLAYVVEFVVTPLSLTLSFTQNYKLQLKWDAIRLSGVVFAFMCANHFDLNLNEAAIGLSISLILSYSYLLWLMWKSLNVDLK